METTGKVTEWGNAGWDLLANIKSALRGLRNPSFAGNTLVFQDGNKKWQFVASPSSKPKIPYCERMAKNAIQVVVGNEYALAIKPKGK